jgi:hypothetical protein
MDELLKKLLEAEVLSEETKTELEEAMKSHLQEAVEAAKRDATEQVRIELTEQWINERDVLIEAIDFKVEDYLKNEIAELREDISAFRNLEAEYASRLVEAKHEMATELQEDLAELIEKLDAFLEIRLQAEFEELTEDIQEAKKLQFGKKVFESFVQEYRKSFIDEDSTEAELRDVRESYEQATEGRKQAEKKLAGLERKIRMEKVLKPLSGKQYEIMETILKSVPTEGLEEAYKTFIGRVLKESVDKESEKEDEVLAESKSVIEERAKKAVKDKKDDDKKFKVKTGDTEEEEEDVDDKKAMSEAVTESWKRLAGLN